MSERPRTRHLPKGPSGHASKGFRSLLVPVDLSPSSDRVLGRLALLPLAADARITLLHAVPGILPSRDQRSAERDAKRALRSEARHLAKSLPRTVRIEPIVELGAPHRKITDYAQSMKAELIVMGRGGGRALRDIFLGSTAERVIRQTRLPVLVVRLPPRSAYSRPALALELDQAAHEVLGLMLRMVPPPRPSVAVIHAFEPPFHRYVYPSLTRDEAEDRLASHQLEASQELARLLAAALARAKVTPEEAPLWKPHVRFGSPRMIIEKAVEKAETDLLVLGTKGHAGVAHMFLGTVAGDVLRAVASDVLVVPPRHAPERGKGRGERSK